LFFSFLPAKQKWSLASQSNTAGLRFERDENGVAFKIGEFWECTEKSSDLKVKAVEVKGMEIHTHLGFGGRCLKFHHCNLKRQHKN